MLKTQNLIFNFFNILKVVTVLQLFIYNTMNIITLFAYPFMQRCGKFQSCCISIAYLIPQRNGRIQCPVIIIYLLQMFQQTLRSITVSKIQCDTNEPSYLENVIFLDTISTQQLFLTFWYMGCNFERQHFKTVHKKLKFKRSSANRALRTQRSAPLNEFI